MTHTQDFIRRALSNSECHEGVSRNGHYEPCDKPAVAIRRDNSGRAYPVCAYHSRGDMVTLDDIREALDV